MKLKIIQYLISFAFISIGMTANASTNHSISWKLIGSNLSFFHREDDLNILAPEGKNDQLETMYAQYQRLFTNLKKVETKKYVSKLEEIVTNPSITEWDDVRNTYRTTYADSCETDNAAFCQRISLSLSNPPSGKCQWFVGERQYFLGNCASSLEIAIPIDKYIKVVVKEIDRTKAVSQTVVHVKGKVIIALGDSFASGEGNPDRPTVHIDSIAKANSGYNFFLSRSNAWRFDKDQGPRWLDRTCHRSLLSNQFKIALRYAKENPSERIVFASFSCSGAEILKGLLQPQNDLPHKADLFYGEEPVDAQLANAVKFLCNGKVHRNYVPVDPQLQTSKIDRYLRVTCQYPAKLRKPDLILLSIGGNDIGFGSLSLDSIYPDYRMDTSPLKILFGIDAFKEMVRKSGLLTDPDKAQKAIEAKLRALYNLLHQELKISGLYGQKQSKVLQMNYPNILSGCDQKWDKIRDNDNSVGFHGAKFIMDLEEPPLIRSALNWYIDSHADISISSEEAEEIRDKVILKLQYKVKENTRFYEWQVVQLNENEVTQHSLCALDEKSGFEPSVDKSFSFPYREQNGWKNDFKPSVWQPYWAERKRWFNTGDDAIMKSATRRCPEKWQIDNPECHEMLKGGLHPNLAFHARSADVMYGVAKNILKKETTKSCDEINP